MDKALFESQVEVNHDVLVAPSTELGELQLAYAGGSGCGDVMWA